MNNIYIHSFQTKNIFVFKVMTSQYDLIMDLLLFLLWLRCKIDKSVPISSC